MQSISMTRSIVSCNFSSPRIPRSQRSKTFFFNPICHFPIQKNENGSLFSGIRSLNNPSTKQILPNNTNTKRNFVVYCNLPSADQLPFGTLPDSWQGWLLGLLIPAALSFFTNKWGPLQNWTKNFKGAVQAAENIAEAVEDVAEKVDKIAEDIVADLPEGKLKSAVSFIENAAEEIGKDAQMVDNLIDKFQEVEEKVEAFIQESNKVDTETKAQKQI